MAGRYIGIEPIKLQDGRIIKHNEIVEEMPDNEAKKRYSFEPVSKKKPEIKKQTKEFDNE